MLTSASNMYSFTTHGFSGELSGSSPSYGGEPVASPPTTELRKAFVVLGALAGLMLIFSILGIISFVLWFMATGNLKRYSKRLGIGRTGMILQLASAIIAVVGVIGLIALASSVGEILFEEPTFGTLVGAKVGLLGALIGALIVGAILAVIGGIMFGLMLMRMPEEGLDREFRTAGILYLVDAAILLIPLVDLVSLMLWFISAGLIYGSSKRSLKSLEKEFSKDS